MLIAVDLQGLPKWPNKKKYDKYIDFDEDTGGREQMVRI